MLLACKNITKSFGANDVLKNVSFMLQPREKAALVGVNGAGKTTLFKVITGELAADAGEIALAKGAVLGYLAQLSPLDDKNTVYDEMLSIFNPLLETEAELRCVEALMAGQTGAALTQSMNRYTRLLQDFESAGGYSYKSRIKGVIKGLGFDEDAQHMRVGAFSGGQKTRLALAKLLLTSPDLLLLDEPTNHLDVESIHWLETFLKSYEGAVLLISHDRYFIDKIAVKVIEIENATVAQYNGSYSFYVQKKAEAREIQKRHYDDQQKEIKRQEDVIRKLKSFNREKSVKRAESREKALAKIERADKPENLPETARMLFAPRRQSGRDVLTAEALAKAFGDKHLFDRLSFHVEKGDKIALLGANGTGKTTLLRIILGEIAADSGSVAFGTGVVTAYYDQAQQRLDPGKSIFQEIADAHPQLDTLTIRNALASFIFTGDDAFKPIAALSGGERGRVALLKMMLSGANFLILDEPTNHLDVFSKEVLEQALAKYEGTVLFVSHDRYFINRIATKLIELENGKATAYSGNYDDMMVKKAQIQADKPPEQMEGTAKTSENKAVWQQAKTSQAESRKFRARLLKTEARIAETESEIAALSAQMAQPDVATDANRLGALYDAKAELDAALMRLYEEWDSLSPG